MSLFSVEQNYSSQVPHQLYQKKTDELKVSRPYFLVGQGPVELLQSTISVNPCQQEFQ